MRSTSRKSWSTRPSRPKRPGSTWCSARTTSIRGWTTRPPPVSSGRGWGGGPPRPGRVQRGPAVTCPLFHYHPALVAQMAATTDRLSGGRLMLGVGTGEAINERPLGWSFPGYKGRQERMEEALEIIHRMFAGEKLTFEGEHYKTDSAKLYSPP